jgi:hypothetical protein
MQLGNRKLPVCRLFFKTAWTPHTKYYACGYQCNDNNNDKYWNAGEDAIDTAPSEITLSLGCAWHATTYPLQVH